MKNPFKKDKVNGKYYIKFESNDINIINIILRYVLKNHLGKTFITTNKNDN